MSRRPNLNTRIFSILAALTLLTLAFQNCSPVNFAHVDALAPAATSGDPVVDIAAPTPPPPPFPPPMPTPDTTEVIKKIKPSLAVSGLQCIMCHAKLESNIVTDFGYGTANFNWSSNASASFFSGDTVYGNARGSWQSAQIRGSVYVPAVKFDPAEAASVFGGSNPPLSFKETLMNPSVGPYNTTMSIGIMPNAGMDAVNERKSILISYPTEGEIIGLTPAANRNDFLYVGVTNNATSGSSVSGLAADSSGKFVRNSGTVSCKGDVVIKGPLFLKNLNISTDLSGCRLYVSGSVFLQGPITYTGAGAKPNLQIASARAIVMGFSAARLGATATSTGLPRHQSDADGMFNGKPGGPYIRLSRALDERYEPGVAPAMRGLLADKIVMDSVSIGSELLDAADDSLVANPPAGSTVELGRLSINYTGVVLNAPHIHSRYAGSVKGVMIADIAIFLLGASNNNNAHFIYDPVFDDVPAILPALPRTTFSMSND
jgi:hypothetical protein